MISKHSFENIHTFLLYVDAIICQWGTQDSMANPIQLGLVKSMQMAFSELHIAMSAMQLSSLLVLCRTSYY